MQQVSQGSLKLQAHHDKIANSGAQSTKSKFLENEFQYLTQLKQHCKALQVTLRPNVSPPTHRITKLIDSLRKELLAEVVSTRRETAFAQLPLSSPFDQRLVVSYEQGVVRMDKRLERMENLVQNQEDKNRAKAVSGQQDYLKFKNPLLKKISQEFIKRSQAVHELMKKKLLLAAKVKALEQGQIQNNLLFASRDQLSHLGYFAQRNGKYYRNKTAPPRSIVNPTVKTRPLRPSSSNSTFYQLYHIQRNIFESELEQLKCENSRLKSIIDSLNAALRQRDNLALLQNLSASQRLEVEESKARQLLFYMINNDRTRDKIQSCSYFWATLSPSESPRNKWKSKEDNTEEQHAKNEIVRGVIRKKRKVFSAQKVAYGKETSFSQSKNVIKYEKKESGSSPFSTVQLKSNERTNTSLESCSRPF